MGNQNLPMKKSSSSSNVNSDKFWNLCFQRASLKNQIQQLRHSYIGKAIPTPVIEKLQEMQNSVSLLTEQINEQQKVMQSNAHSNGNPWTWIL